MAIRNSSFRRWFSSQNPTSGIRLAFSARELLKYDTITRIPSYSYSAPAGPVLDTTLRKHRAATHNVVYRIDHDPRTGGGPGDRPRRNAVRKPDPPEAPLS